jgi:cysteine desulfurase
MKTNSTYLDYNATAPLLPTVADALPEIAAVFGNPSSPHAPGVEARRRIESARRTIADFIGAESGQIIFTSGATESNNFVFKSVLARSEHRKPHILTSSVEHPAVLEPCKELVRNGLADVGFLPVDTRGIVRPRDVENYIRPETILISVMAANNEVGSLQPIKEIVTIAHSRQVPVHTDAAQLFGRMPLSVNQLGVEYLCASGHKVGALKGVGFLYARQPALMLPMLWGGPQENRHRPGTENTSGILSLEMAVKTLGPTLEKEANRVRHLSQQLWDGIRGRVPGSVLNTPMKTSLPNTLNISFEGCIGSALSLSLADEGIHVSTTSACETGHRDLSHVLQAMNVQDPVNRSAIRFSLGHGTTQNHIERVLDILPGLVNKVREL